MQGKTKPDRLIRVGNTLYKRLTSDGVEGSDPSAIAAVASGSAEPVAAAALAPAVTSAAAAAAAVAAGPADSHVVMMQSDGLGGSQAASLKTGSEAVAWGGSAAAGGGGGGGSSSGSSAIPSVASDDAAGGGSACPAGGPGVASLGAGAGAGAGSTVGSHSILLVRQGSGAVLKPSVSGGPLLSEARASHRSSGVEDPLLMGSGVAVAAAPVGRPSSGGAVQLLRPRSASRVMPSPAEGPRPSGTVALAGGGGSGTGGGGGLLGGLVKDFGLGIATAGTEWAGEAGAVGASRAAADDDAADSAAAAARIAAAAGIHRGITSEAEGEDLCIICYDKPPTCVFLECGHGGFCKRYIDILVAFLSLREHP